MYNINNNNPICKTISLIILNSLLSLRGKLNNKAFERMTLILDLTKFKSSFFYYIYFNIIMKIDLQ